MQQPPLEFATAEQVWERLRDEVTPGPTTTVPIAESLGARLAEDARVQLDYPPFDRAVMDGYAVQSSSFTAGGATLHCAGLVRAGAADHSAVTAGHCLRINTGAPLPDGADAVVMVEKSRENEDDQVTFDDQPAPGQHIERRASLRKAGDLLARAGSTIAPGTLAALVAGGLAEVRTFARPPIALLSTGDELRPAGAALGHGQIHDSNRIALQHLAAPDGTVQSLGTAPDQPAALRAKLEEGLAADVLIIVGGMSKGSHDFVPRVLEEMGIAWLVTSLNLKPGKPTRIGRLNDTWVLGLPGNPVSAAVCFLLFARPLLAGLQGLPVAPPPVLRGQLTSELPACGARPMYQPARWETTDRGEILIAPIDWAGSGDPFGMATANALLQRDPHAPAAPRGQTTLFHPLGLPT